MAEMADHHDAVSGRDTQDSSEADERAERQYAAGEQHAADAADEGEGKCQRDECRYSPGLKIDVEDKENADKRQGGECIESTARFLPCRVFSQEFRVILAVELQLTDS